MQAAISDAQRRHRTGTSKAMKRMVRHCPACGRGQYPQRFRADDAGRVGYVCRYCRHEWTAGRAALDQGHG